MISPRHRSSKTKSTASSSLSKPSLRKLPLDDDDEKEHAPKTTSRPPIQRSTTTSQRSSSAAKSRGGGSVSCRNLDSRKSRPAESKRPGSVQRHRSSADGSILQRRALSVQRPRRPDANQTETDRHEKESRTTALEKRSSSTVRRRREESSQKTSQAPDSPAKITRRKISGEDGRSVPSSSRGESPGKPSRRKISGDDGRVPESPVKPMRRKTSGDDGRSVQSSSRRGHESPEKPTRRKISGDDGRSVQSSSRKGHENLEKPMRRKTSLDDGRSAHSRDRPRSKRSASSVVRTSNESPSRRRSRRVDDERRHKSSSTREKVCREKSNRHSGGMRETSSKEGAGKALRRPSLLDTAATAGVPSNKSGHKKKPRHDESDSESGGSLSTSSSSHHSHSSGASTVIQFDPTQKNGVAHVEQKESVMDDDDCLSIASFHDPIGDAHRIMKTNTQRAPILSFLDSDGEEMDETEPAYFSPKTEVRCPSGGESVQGSVLRCPSGGESVQGSVMRCPSGGESVQTSDSNASSTFGKLQFYVPSASATKNAPGRSMLFDDAEFQDLLTSSVDHSWSTPEDTEEPKRVASKMKSKEDSNVGAAAEEIPSSEGNVKKVGGSKKKSKECEEVVDVGNSTRQLKSRSSRRVLKKSASSEQLFEAAVLQLKNESNGLHPPSDDDDSDSEDERLRHNFNRTVGLGVGMTAYESELEVSPSKKPAKTGLGIGKYFFGNSNRKRKDGDEDASDSEYSCSSTSSRRSVFGGRLGRRHSLLGNGDFENAVVPFSS